MESNSIESNSIESNSIQSNATQSNAIQSKAIQSKAIQSKAIQSKAIQITITEQSTTNRSFTSVVNLDTCTQTRCGYLWLGRGSASCLAEKLQPPDHPRAGSHSECQRSFSGPPG